MLVNNAGLKTFILCKCFMRKEIHFKSISHVCWSSKIHSMSLTLNVNRRDFNQLNMKTKETETLKTFESLFGCLLFLLTAYETRRRHRSENSSVLLPPAVLTSKQKTVFHNISQFSLLLLIRSHIRSFFSYIKIFNSYMCSHLTQIWKCKTCIWCKRPSINLCFCSYIWRRPEIFHIRALNFSVREEVSLLKIWLISGNKSCVVVKM